MKLGPKATKHAKREALSAAGWREDGFQWVDPHTKQEWGFEFAWELEHLWRAQQRLEAAGWMLASGSINEGRWMHVIEIADPAPEAGEKRFCSIHQALRRLDSRGGR